MSYNSLESYGASLQDALTRPYPPYEKIGVLGPDGEYRQLAVTLLQIENEFYGTIRPKRVIRQGERPLHALRERGIEYVEVRLMDLDPFCPIGIGAATIRFLDVFLLHCLLSDSPPDTPGEIAALGRNQHRAAARGREPGLRLERQGKDSALSEWGAQVVAECGLIAAALDAVHNGNAYGDAVSAAAAALGDPALVPSARVLEAMARKFDSSYVRFALAQSLQHHDTLQSNPPSADVEQRFARMAEESHQEQKRIEAADTMPFEIYRQQYLSRERLVV